MDRGKLREIILNQGKISESKSLVFVFHKGEPVTCSNCKKDLGIACWVCERCKAPFCYDCVKDSKDCNCHNISYDEHIHHKADVEREK